MIVKLIILFIVIWLGLRIYLAVQAKKAKPPTVKQVQDMVRCEVCGTHTPVDEAIKVGNKYFCSPDHLPKPK